MNTPVNPPRPSSSSSSLEPDRGRGTRTSTRRSFRRIAVLFLIGFLAVLFFGTLRNPNFWRRPDQRGDTLLAKKRFTEAAKTYTNPWGIGAAQYRNGDFEMAAKTFARVPGAIGAFDQGNAWLMHGKYDAAITSYDRALGFHANWKEAEENKTLALARKQMLEASGDNRDTEQSDSDSEDDQPDQIVFDLKGENKNAPATQINGQMLSDAELRATWLRRVQTTPADFLRTKFAYQAATQAQPNQSAKQPK